jgi:Phage Tail Collar Domain
MSTNATDPKPGNLEKQETLSNSPFTARPPVGSVIIYTGNLNSPIEALGWMACDGRQLSAYLYPQLFATIGYSYGGSERNFNIPNLPAPFAGLSAAYIICFL